MRRSTTSLLLACVIPSAFASSYLSTAAPAVPGQAWSHINGAWSATPFGGQLYTFGEILDCSSTFRPTLHVLDGVNGTLVDELFFATGVSTTDISFDPVFLVTRDGDVIVRSTSSDFSSATSTALQRYNMTTKQLVWEIRVGTNEFQPYVGTLSGGYVYSTIGTQIRVVDAANGTVVNSFLPAAVSTTLETSLLTAPTTARPAGAAGWLVIPQYHVLQGYSLADPANPKLAWNSTDEAGTFVALASAPQVSLDGRWVVGMKTINTFPAPSPAVVAVIDTATGAARTRALDHAASVFGASGTLALVSTTVTRGGTVSSTFGTFNLTSMEYVEHVRPHVLGNVQCGLATDGLVFVCATQASTGSSTFSLPGIGFTVFDATSSGTITATYAPSMYNWSYVPSVDPSTSLTVVSSTDGHWYNVFFFNNVAMVQVPRV